MYVEKKWIEMSDNNNNNNNQIYEIMKTKFFTHFVQYIIIFRLIWLHTYKHELEDHAKI